MIENHEGCINDDIESAKKSEEIIITPLMDQSAQQGESNELTLYKSCLKKQLNARKPGRYSRALLAMGERHSESAYMLSFMIATVAFIAAILLLLPYGFALYENAAESGDVKRKHTGAALMISGGILVVFPMAVCLAGMFTVSRLERRFGSIILSEVDHHFEKLEGMIDSLSKQKVKSTTFKHHLFSGYLRGSFSKGRSESYMLKLNAVDDELETAEVYTANYAVL